MSKTVYDPDGDGKIALAELVLIGQIESHHRGKIVSNDLRHSIDAEVNQLGQTYTKKKTLTFTNGYKGDMRVKFDIKSTSAANAAKGILTKNGATPTVDDIGAEQSQLDTTYVTKSQDVAIDFVPGDTIDLWIKTVHDSVTAYVINLRFYYTENAAIIVTTSGGD